MQITFDPFIPHEKALVESILGRSTAPLNSGAAEPAVANNTGSVVSSAPSEGDAGGYTGEAATGVPLAEASPASETPKKRGRKPKAETAAAPVEDDEPALDQPPEAGAEADDPPTIDDARKALQAFTANNSVPEGVALLKEFGVARIGELAAGDYHAFIKRCNQ